MELRKAMEKISQNMNRMSYEQLLFLKQEAEAEAERRGVEL